MSNSSASYYRYWGKARPTGDTKGASYHLLVYHCLDVAAVGRLLLDPQQALCKSMATRLEVDPAWLRDWFTFCLLLHDVGKFCRSFQNLARNQSDRLVPYEPGFSYEKRHDSLGFALGRELSASLADLGLLRVSQWPWLEIVCGHHGRPPDKSITTLRPYALPEDQQAAESFVRDCAQKVELLPELGPLAQIDEKVFRSVSWQLAGVSVLADWLGSSQQVFRYVDEEMSLLNYWREHASLGANTVVKEAGFIQKPIQAFKSVKQQFGFQEPTPLQSYAEKVSLNEPQHLFLLEDVTGAGKTEAAMVIVHRLLQAGLANGMYIGLPTMATANAMYKRMSDVYHRLYKKGSEQPSLILAHGGRDLSTLFTESVGLSDQEKDKDYSHDDRSASTYCNQWLADNRKKALLADVGVGTIDQALLGVLPVRHQSLRLLGLSNKVLLVDEVHAYDPYMLALLTTLLEAHASQGGSAILLSATVPFQLRKKLVAAYAKGAGFKTDELKARDAYPLVTLLNSSGHCETAVETRETVRRTVKVERLTDEEEAFVRIRSSIAQGQCVCWVRNTVKDAREAYSHLLNQEWVDSRTTLFHSRFAMVDRQRIEEAVQDRFGDKSDSDARTGQVLIATQVVEQSLDLDFDVMISDLAPIDLLIQRAGRLQRHVRSSTGNRNAQEQREPPCLYLLSPDPQQVADSGWLKQLLPGTQAIYPHVGQLWLTARAVLQKRGFSMPDDARPLIEGVYGEQVQDEMPPVLLEQSNRALAKQRAEHGMGVFNQLQLDKGYTWRSAEQSGGWNEDVHVSTRLMKKPTATVALARYTGDNLVPYAGNIEHGWALSQVSVPLKEWEEVERKLSERSRSDAEKLKRETPALKWVEVLPLIEPMCSVYDSEEGWNAEKLAKL